MSNAIAVLAESAGDRDKPRYSQRDFEEMDVILARHRENLSWIGMIRERLGRASREVLAAVRMGLGKTEDLSGAGNTAGEEDVVVPIKGRKRRRGSV
jgi:hypothetical protein